VNISDIRCYAFWLGFRNVCLVKVETDEGFHGWGESGLSGREQAVMGAVAHFREFLLGRDATRPAALWQEMYRGQYFEGGRVLAAAIAAIDIALHDLNGKALGQPVHRLIGGRQRDRVPLFVTSTKRFGQELVDDLVRLRDDGWQALRVTAGEPGDPHRATRYDPRQSLAEAAHWLTRAREALGPDVTLGIDFHHRLSAAEAASFCQRMPRGTLDFLEEPIRDESPSAYAALRDMVDVPFAIGEEFTSKWDFAPYLESGLTQFGRVDICNAGGFTESMKIAAACETKYIDMMPHNPLSPICTAASVHYCAAIPNLAWLELMPYDGDWSDYDRIFVNRPEVQEHHFTVGERPGLGIDVNEELISDLEFRYWEAPRLVRPDGSYTNW
jgi:galactonate dehydratase